MKYLVKNVLVLDKRSPFYQKTIDFIVENGTIISIDNKLTPHTDEIIVEGKKLVLSTALIDINASSGEPQDLESETLDSLIEVATHGGYAYVTHIPNEKKLTQSKSDIIFLKSKNQNTICQVLPIGNITRNDNEQVMSAMMDMKQAGAVAFSDGNEHTLKLNMLKNALLYAKGFNGKIIVHPEKKDLSKNGQVTQGVMSVNMGFKGVPKEAEFMAVQEIVQIVQYVESDILLLNITTPESIDIISQANKKSKSIYTSTSSAHLLLDEVCLEEYDTNYKLNPPLRNSKDRDKLRKAVLDGKIDIVYSQHSPCTPEEKVLEFDLASKGMIQLQTSFLTCVEALGEKNIEKCIEVTSTNPAQYLGIEFEIFDKGVRGDFTLVDIEGNYTLTLDNNQSKSKNSPFINRPFKGKIKGLIAHGKQCFFE